MTHRIVAVIYKNMNLIHFIAYNKDYNIML